MQRICFVPETRNNRHLTQLGLRKAENLDILFRVYPDDSGKELATVLSYLAGRSLSREEIWTAMELPRSTYYDQLDKGTLITADNLRVAAANLGINRAELLTRYRFIEPEEVTALAEEIRGGTANARRGGGRQPEDPAATDEDCGVAAPLRCTTAVNP